MVPHRADRLPEPHRSRGARRTHATAQSTPNRRLPHASSPTVANHPRARLARHPHRLLDSAHHLRHPPAALVHPRDRRLPPGVSLPGCPPTPVRCAAAPLWIVSGFVGGCIGAWLGNGLELFLRASTVAVVILWGSALIAWVTPTAELAGSLRFFLRPLWFLGAPVDQWSLVMASALRGLPMLRDQAQAVLDTAKLRLGQDVSTLSLGSYARLSVDVITAILSATSRGAAETGRAMSMRGALEASDKRDKRRRGRRAGLGWVDVCMIAITLLGVAGVVARRLMQ